jgi:ABC-type amino acid transport substrate-binding protein
LQALLQYQNMRKITTSFLLLFLIFSPYLPISAKENKKQSTIKVGVYDNPPKVFINKNGKPDGIFIAVIKSVARKENIQIEYFSGEWNQLKEMLYKGEIDVLPDVAYSNERDSIFSLSTLPVLGSWLEVFTTRATKINSVLDLQNKRIGVLKGSIQDGYLKNVVNKDFNLSNEILLYKDYSSSVVSLKNNEIDVILADRFFYFSELCDEEILPTGIIFRPAELYFAFTKGKDADLVALFDKNIAIQKNNSNSDYYKSLKRWLDKDYKAGTPQYIFWLILIIGSVLLIVSAFAFLLRYKVNAKTKMLRMKNLELILV